MHSYSDGYGGRQQPFPTTRGNRKCEESPGRVDRVLKLPPACDFNAASLIPLRDEGFYPAARGLPVSVLKTGARAEALRSAGPVTSATGRRQFRIYTIKTRPHLKAFNVLLLILLTLARNS